MSLEDAETDYLERVLEDCDGDRAAAAEILGLTVAVLNEKLS
jgi:DNA-binding protein Fis